MLTGVRAGTGCCASIDGDPPMVPHLVGETFLRLCALRSVENNRKIESKNEDPLELGLPVF